MRSKSIFDLTDRYKLILWGLLFAMTPMYLLSTPVLSVFLLVVMCLWFSVEDKTWLLIFPLIFFVYPQEVSALSGSLGQIQTLKALFPAILVFLIIVWGVKNKAILYIGKKVSIVLSVIVLLIVSFAYSIFFSERATFQYTVYMIVYSVCYYFGLKNYRISPLLFFYALDIVFFVLSFYALIEIFFHFSPYNDMYYSLDGSEYYYHTSSFFRVKSLCGHPLLFVGFLILYQVSIYIRLMCYKKQTRSLVFLAFSFFVSFLTISRSAYVIESVMLITWVFSVFSNITRKNFGYLSVGVIFFIILYFSSSDYFATALERFDASQGSEENRLAAFQVAGVIFQHEPWGIGLNFSQMFNMYRSQFSIGFNVDVLDNALLSIICEYGVFSLFFIKILLSPTLDSFCTIKRNKQLVKAFWILNMSVFLLSFSFNITLYYSLMIMYTSIIISLYHCSLQYISMKKTCN